MALAVCPGSSGGGSAGPLCRVVFLDTDGWPGAREVLRRGAFVTRLVGALTAAGLPEDAIGIMSPYKAQVCVCVCGCVCNVCGSPFPIMKASALEFSDTGL